jgi:hypothetical protein
MKTLDQVEPRIPLSQDDVPIILSIPGSYYLTESLFSTGAAPNYIIRIADNDITLGLNGFFLDATTDVAISFSAILVQDSVQNTEIRNGTIRDADHRGINAQCATATRLIDVRLQNNGNDGARLGPASNAIRCNATKNGGAGIYAEGSGSIITQCVARSNTGSGLIATGGTIANKGARSPTTHCSRTDATASAQRETATPRTTAASPTAPPSRELAYASSTTPTTASRPTTAPATSSSRTSARATPSTTGTSPWATSASSSTPRLPAASPEIPAARPPGQPIPGRITRTREQSYRAIE